jgi:hypothetical protein
VKTVSLRTEKNFKRNRRTLGCTDHFRFRSERRQCELKPQVGNHPLSTLYGIISKRRCVLPLNCSLEKNQVPRELLLIAISLACLVAQLNSYSGSWKWVTILPILVGIVQLLFAISFCIPSYVHQHLHSLDSKNFVHHNSLVFFYPSWDLSWCRVSFLNWGLQFSKLF